MWRNPLIMYAPSLPNSSQSLRLLDSIERSLRRRVLRNVKGLAARRVSSFNSCLKFSCIECCKSRHRRGIHARSVCHQHRLVIEGSCSSSGEVFERIRLQKISSFQTSTHPVFEKLLKNHINTKLYRQDCMGINSSKQSE